MFDLYPGNCLDTLQLLDDNSVDSIVCDPPYGLSFMGKRWDYDVPGVEIWAECLRVLKPGGHLLAFAGTRTQHRMAVRIEDAGFEIRDMIAWVYGSGFPKSLDVSKAIDKARDDSADILRVTTFMADAADRARITRADVDTHMGTSDMGGWWLSRLQHRCQCPKWDQWLQLKALLGLSDEMDAEVWRLNGRKGQPGEAWVEREVVGRDTKARSTSGASALPTMGGETVYQSWDITAPVTDAARQWQGWGTALKPALEPITVARKPLTGTVAENVLQWGTGAVNVDGCRVGMSQEDREFILKTARPNTAGQAHVGAVMNRPAAPTVNVHDAGRWPANLIHDGSDEVLAAFPQAAGQLAKASTSDTQRAGQNAYGVMARGSNGQAPRGDAGSAARFFYCAKASKKDRNEGCESLPLQVAGGMSGRRDGSMGSTTYNNNTHPTVKPTDLMRYLCRLVTPPGGLVLDPFMGSGSTGKAAMLEGFRFIGCEMNAEYLAIAQARIAHALLGELA